MCGLVGIINGNYNMTLDDKRTFKEMLIADSVRGDDATGVFGITKEGVCHVLKIAANPYALFADPAWTEFIRREYITMIGHNRLATSGGNSTKHAHPFRSKNITLAHNGTLKTGTWLPDIDEKIVDSEALCRGIADLGIKEALTRTHGAYAVVMYDDQEKALSLFRNYERPLCIAQDYITSRAYIASEPAMLDWFSARMAKHLSIKMITSNVQYKYGLGEAVPVQGTLPTEKSYRPVAPSVQNLLPLIGVDGELTTVADRGAALSKRERKDQVILKKKYSQLQTAYENQVGFKIEEQVYFYNINQSPWGTSNENVLIEGWMDGLDGMIRAIIPATQGAILENVSIIRGNIKRIQRTEPVKDGKITTEWILWLSMLEPIWNYTDIDALEEQLNIDDSKIDAGFDIEMMEKYQGEPKQQEGSKSRIILPPGVVALQDCSKSGDTCGSTSGGGTGDAKAVQEVEGVMFEENSDDIEYIKDVALVHNILH